MNKLKIVKKNYTENIIVLIRFLSSLCEQTLIFSLPLLFYITFNNNLKTSSFAFSVIQFADLVALPIAGFIIARFFAYKVFFVSDFFRGISCIFIYFLIKSEFVYIFLFLYGFLCAVTLVNIETVIPKIFKYYSLSGKQSILQIIEQSTLILGPALASLFLYFSMFHIFLIVCSIVFITSGICMYTKNISKLLMFKNENNHSDIKNDFYLAVNVLISNKKLLFLTFSTFVLNFVGAVSLILAPHAFTLFHKTSFLYSITMVGVAIFSIFFVIFFIKKNLFQSIKLEKIGFFSIVTLLIGIILQSLSKNIFLFGLGLLLYHAVVPFYIIFMRTQRAELVPKELFSQCIGLIIFINSISLPLSGLFVNKLIDLFSIFELLSFCFILMTPVIILFFYVYRREIIKNKFT